MPIRKSDYENYDYREFWEDDKRYYEDQSERIALRSLLKGVDTSNKLFIDIGCGYARLFNEYSRFPRIILIDYSMKNLKNARERISRFLSDDPSRLSNILFISADATLLPIKSDSTDVILTVRVVHHLDRPEKYFDEVKRVLKDNSLYFLEFANKRNLKNILRFTIGKMDTSPFGPDPFQIGETIRNYHPKEINRKLIERGITIKKVLSVSNFRLGILKKIFGNRLLIFFENIYQKVFSFITWGPSLFLKGILSKETGSSEKLFAERDFEDNESHKPVNMNRKIFFKDLLIRNLSNFNDILICPDCYNGKLDLSGDKIKCNKCGHIYFTDGNIIDFKK